MCGRERGLDRDTTRVYSEVPSVRLEQGKSLVWSPEDSFGIGVEEVRVCKSKDL